MDPPLPSPRPFFLASPFPSSARRRQQPLQPLMAYSPAPPLLLPSPMAGGGTPLLCGVFPPTPSPFTGAVAGGLFLPSPGPAMSALSGDVEMELEQDGIGTELEQHDPHSLGMTPANLLRLPLLLQDAQGDRLLHLLATYLQYEHAFAAACDAPIIGGAPPDVAAVQATLASLRAAACAQTNQLDGKAKGHDDKAMMALVLVVQAQAILGELLNKARALAAAEAAVWDEVEADAATWEKEAVSAVTLKMVPKMGKRKGEGKGKKKPKTKKAKTAAAAAAAPPSKPSISPAKPPRPPSTASSTDGGTLITKARRGLHFLTHHINPLSNLFRIHRTQLAVSATAPLLAWLLEHYPGKHAPTTSTEKTSLMRASGLQEKQIVCFFSNYKYVCVMSGSEGL